MGGKLSPAQWVAYSSLLQAMAQAVKEIRGVKIRVPEEQTSLLKRAFYQCRNESPDWKELTLLTTTNPSEFLIYHQPNGDTNG